MTMSEDEKEKQEKRDNIFEVLDDLIYHLNTTRNMFTFLIISSFILAPISFVVAAVFVLYPRFLNLLLQRAPELGAIIILFIGVSVILAGVWLAIGIKERSFFSKWNKRFNRFMSLKERMDKELGD
jgi:hypothetical protein